MPCFKLGQKKQTVNESVHTAYLAVDDLKVTRLLFRLRSHSVAQPIDVSPNGGEGGAQIMGHFSDEFPPLLFIAELLLHRFLKSGTHGVEIAEHFAEFVVAVVIQREVQLSIPNTAGAFRQAGERGEDASRHPGRAQGIAQRNNQQEHTQRQDKIPLKNLPQKKAEASGLLHRAVDRNQGGVRAVNHSRVPHKGDFPRREDERLAGVGKDAGRPLNRIVILLRKVGFNDNPVLYELDVKFNSIHNVHQFRKLLRIGVLRLFLKIMPDQLPREGDAFLIFAKLADLSMVVEHYDAGRRAHDQQDQHRGDQQHQKI